MLEKLAADTPEFPWAHLGLAEVHTYGKFADHPFLRRELEKYFVACPASTFERALSLASQYGAPEFAGKLARELRDRLESAPDPVRTDAWETLWNLEFKAHPPNEHDLVRQQLTADLARLEQAPHDSDEAWLQFLKSARRMMGDQAKVAAVEDRILANYPRSSEAQQVRRARFNKAHPHPQPGGPEDQKQAFYHAQLQFADEQLRQAPDESEYLMMRLDALGQLTDAKPEDVAAAGEAVVAAIRKGVDGHSIPPVEFQVARAFVTKNVDLDRVPGLIADGLKSAAQHEHQQSDREPDERRISAADTQFFVETQGAEILIDAAKELKNPGMAKALVDKVAAARPEKGFVQMTRWNVIARFAELEGRKLDALLMYRAAIEAVPSNYRAPKKEEIAGNIERLWKELGGSAAGRELWEKKGKKIEVAMEGRWEQPNKPLPPWELMDLRRQDMEADHAGRQDAADQRMGDVVRSLPRGASASAEALCAVEESLRLSDRHAEHRRRSREGRAVHEREWLHVPCAVW